MNGPIQHFTFVLPLAAALHGDFMAKTTIYQNFGDTEPKAVTSSSNERFEDMLEFVPV